MSYLGIRPRPRSRTARLRPHPGRYGVLSVLSSFLMSSMLLAQQTAGTVLLLNNVTE